MKSNKRNRAIDSVEYKTRLDRVYNNHLGACATCHVWKGLQDKGYDAIYSQATYFWRATLIALQNEWLLSWARCFENSSYSKADKVISVQALLRYHPDITRQKQTEELLEKHKRVIASVARLRDHQLAHLNAEHLAAPSKLLQHLPINYGEVETLFGNLPELFSLLNPEAGNG